MDALHYIRPLLGKYWKINSKVKRIFGCKDSQIVICGYPRSGTSLLYNMVSANIENFRCEEFEIEAIRRLHRSGNYVTKFPLDVLNIEKIYNANVLKKNIFIIIVTRDIRDVITSRHPNLPEQYFIGFKNSWWPQNRQFSEWKYDAPGIGEIYNAINTCRKTRRKDILEVKYEDLVLDSSLIQRKIEKMTGAKFTGKFSDFYKKSEKHAYKYTGRYQAKDEGLVRENKQIDSSRIAKWKKREHSRILIEQFTVYPELFDILVREGYEQNNEWFNEIKSMANESF